MPMGNSAQKKERGGWRRVNRGAICEPHPALPEDTQLWAALVHASGGVWGGCVYDAESIVAALDKAGQ